MPSFVIYARKSTESEDQQVLSIESQIREMKAIAARQGVVVSEILTESRSAKAPGRPVFGALMRRVRRGEVNGILCWKMDRLARNHYDTGQVLQALADQRVERIITSDGVKTSDSNDRLLGTFEFALATKYIDDLRQNVKRGNRARFERGWPNYRPPPGYVEDRATKTIVKDPERFDLIRRCWDLMLTGAMRPVQILKVLNDQWGYRGRKTKRQGGGPMPLCTLYKIFRNPFYMRVIRLRSGITYKGAYEPMVTPQEFDRAQEILGGGVRPRPWRHEFTYTGILRCATCKRPLIGEQHVKPSGKRFVYYRCHPLTGQPTCAEPAVPERLLDEQILADLKRTRLSEAVSDWIRESLRASLSTELTALKGAAASRQRAIDQAKTESTKLLDLSLRGLIDDQIFAARHAELRDRQTRLEVELERPAQTPEQLLQRVDSVLAFSQKAPEVFVSGTPVQRRQIIRAVCSNPEVRGRKALYKANEPFSLFEGSGLVSSWCAIVEDVRTWLLNVRDLRLPDLRTDTLPDTVPRTAKVA